MITTLLILVGALIITNIITWLELSATRDDFDALLEYQLRLLDLDFNEEIVNELENKPKKVAKKVAKKK